MRRVRVALAPSALHAGRMMAGKRVEVCFRIWKRTFSCQYEAYKRLLGTPMQTSSYSSSSNVPAVDTTSSPSSGQAVKISKAMKAYLQRAKEHDEFMKKETLEYEIGKRHLANMMGVDPDNFTQEEMDKAIEYLFPSGLFEPRARPIFKSPQQIFPKKKAAEFDASGRPFHSFFYTSHPNYYQALHDVTKKILELNRFEDNAIRKGIKSPDPHLKVNLEGTAWLDKGELEVFLLEQLRDEDHAYLTLCLSRLAAHPYSGREREFLLKFTKQLIAATMTMEIPKLIYNELGRPFMEAIGKRKHSAAKVVVWARGTGKIEINGTDISYFTSNQSRRQILFPLQFTDLLNSVDVEATVTGHGGLSAEAGAVRHALSLALRSFVNKEMVEKMRLAGLLTFDVRTRERKKPGQDGARKKYTWKKR